MARRVIDISVPLQNDVAADPPGQGRRSNISTISKACRRFCLFFPGLKKRGFAGRARMGG